MEGRQNFSSLIAVTELAYRHVRSLKLQEEYTGTMKVPNLCLDTSGLCTSTVNGWTLVLERLPGYVEDQEVTFE